MPLIELDVPSPRSALPGSVRSFLREAARRIDQFQQRSRVTGFVPSDYESGYHLLRALEEGCLLKGNLFCEWGSGFGVVACLAALCGFEAYGIEIEADLVDAARQLADDFSLAVEFVQGSFLPRGSEITQGARQEYSWLATEAGNTEDELGLGPDDFDVIFAYPWPDEEDLIARLFERHAAAGAVLVTYHGGERFRLRRKKQRRA
jgi:hypothetical protein